MPKTPPLLMPTTSTYFPLPEANENDETQMADSDGLDNVNEDDMDDETWRLLDERAFQLVEQLQTAVADEQAENHANVQVPSPAKGDHHADSSFNDIGDRTKEILLALSDTISESLDCIRQTNDACREMVDHIREYGTSLESRGDQLQSMLRGIQQHAANITRAVQM